MSAKKRTIDAFFGPPKPKVLDAANNTSKRLRGSPSPAPEDKGRDGDVLTIGDLEGASQPPPVSTETVCSHHCTYPFPTANLPPTLAAELEGLPLSGTPGRAIADKPDLDLVYWAPYVPARAARQLFEFLRAELPFYRVEYDIQRGGVSTHVRTPRWTTVFGLDETSRFRDAGTGTANAPDTAPTGPQTVSAPSALPPLGQPTYSSSSSSSAEPLAPNRVATDAFAGDWDIVDARTGRPVHGDRHYARYRPRPIPGCLEALRRGVERATGCRFNFCLVNYYASGRDSISPHSDDERFLGDRPAIASLSLGARRDFVMRHKGGTVPGAGRGEEEGDTAMSSLKLPLGSGDMVLMRGTTQSKWLHSIPKRTGRNAEDGGRINITFRRAMVREGTENYYNYNVGTGPGYRWDAASREMKPWKGSS